MDYRRNIPTTAVNQDTARAAQGGAFTSDGAAVAGVTTVINSIKGTKELAVTLTNTTNAAVSNLKVFPGVAEDAAGSALPEGVTFGGSWSNRAKFLSYFAHISTVSIGLRIETTNVDNILGNNMTFSETEPDAFAVPTKFSIGKYKQDIGGGSYSKEVVIPAQDLTFAIWAGLQMVLERLAANSSITFYFPINGWNKAQGMTPLRSAQL